MVLTYRMLTHVPCCFHHLQVSISSCVQLFHFSQVADIFQILWDPIFCNLSTFKNLAPSMQPSWHCSMPILPVIAFHWAQQKHNLNAILHHFPSKAPGKVPGQAKCNTDDQPNQAKSDMAHSSPHTHFLTSSAGTEGQMDTVDYFLNHQISI